MFYRPEFQLSLLCQRELMVSEAEALRQFYVPSHVYLVREENMVKLEVQGVVAQRRFQVNDGFNEAKGHIWHNQANKWYDPDDSYTLIRGRKIARLVFSTKQGCLRAYKVVYRQNKKSQVLDATPWGTSMHGVLEEFLMAYVPSDKMEFFTENMGGWAVGDSDEHIHPLRDFMTKEVNDLMYRSLGKDIPEGTPILAMAYPALRAFTEDSPYIMDHVVPQGMGPALKKESFAAFVRAITPKVTKAHTKAMAKNWNTLWSLDNYGLLADTIKMMKGYWPLDWYIPIIEKTAHKRVPTMTPEVAQVLRTMTPKKSFNAWMVDIDHRERRFAYDTACMWVRHNTEEGCPTFEEGWLEFHDAMSTFVREGAQKNRDISLPLGIEDPTYTTTRGLKLKLATGTHELKEWSNRANNCIVGYSHQAVAGHCILGGVYEDGDLIANFEIREGQVQQLLGLYNQSLHELVQEHIVEALVEWGVATGLANNAWR